MLVIQPDIHIFTILRFGVETPSGGRAMRHEFLIIIPPLQGAGGNANQFTELACAVSFFCHMCMTYYNLLLHNCLYYI